jgi:hypothetical protein
MDRDLARFVLLLVNDFEQYKRLQQIVDHRIEMLRNSLETSKDPDRIREIQGAIAEMRRWQHLREQVIEAAQ